MTCTSCEAKVKSLLESVENVTNVEVSKEYDSVTISMDRHINLSNFQKVLDAKYTSNFTDFSLCLYHYFIDTTEKRTFYFNGGDAAFYGWVLLSVLIFQIVKFKRFCRKLCHV